MSEEPLLRDAAKDVLDVAFNEPQLGLADQVALAFDLTRNAAISRAIERAVIIYDRLSGRGFGLRDEAGKRLREIELGAAIQFDRKADIERREQLNRGGAQVAASGGWCEFKIRVSPQARESLFWHDHGDSAPATAIWLAYEIMIAEGYGNCSWQAGSVSPTGEFEAMKIPAFPRGISESQAPQRIEEAGLAFLEDDDRDAAWEIIDEVFSTSQVEFQAKLEFAIKLARAKAGQQNALREAMLASCVESSEMISMIRFDKRTYTDIRVSATEYIA